MKRFLASSLTVLAVAVAAVGAVADPAEAFYGTYSQTTPTVNCTQHVDTSGRVVLRTIVPNTPGMFAPAEPAKVSWQPILNRWDAQTQSWVQDVAGPELVGLASVSTTLPYSNGFAINLGAGQYYRVSIVYRWYSGNTVVRATHLWAGQHVSAWKPYGYLGMSNQFDANSYCQL